MDGFNGTEHGAHAALLPRPRPPGLWPGVFMAAARHTPVAMAGGVAALLAAQLALLLASWLPWKMLALLGGGLPLPGWPAAWSLHQTAAALALATVAAYAAYLGADALVGRHARQGAARLVATTAKTGLFNQQDRLAQLLYTHLMRATGAAVFVALAVAVLAWQMPLLAVLSLLFSRPLRPQDLEAELERRAADTAARD